MLRCTQTESDMSEGSTFELLRKTKDTDLLAKTDAGTCIERHEDEGIRSEVAVQPLVYESIRIKLVR